MRRWPDELADPIRLRAAIDRLIERRRADGGLPGLLGEPPRALLLERDRFARLLAADVRARAHRLAPARVRRALLDKERELFVFTAADLVLHGAFAELLTERMEPLLSPRLHSYRRGRSSLRAIGDLCAYLRGHARGEPDPRRRGLHVYHCDVRAYGESIPVADGAPLWRDLEALLGEADDAAWALARGLVRPELEHRPIGGTERGDARSPSSKARGESWLSANDRRATHASPVGPQAASIATDPQWVGAPKGGARAVGLPTGSPVATALTNLYLVELDRALEAMPGLHSARYGDDILVAHPTAEAVRAAAAAIDGLLAARGLEVNAGKRQHLWLTGSGRAPVEDAGATGAQRVIFLGLEVGFRGTVALPPAKERELLAAVRERARRAARLCRDLPEAERGRAVAAAVTGALDPRSPFAVPHADLLAVAVSDRGRLAHLDGLIALAVAESVSGRRGVRAFRDAPPRRQRRSWGLTSLVVRRNRGRAP